MPRPVLVALMLAFAASAAHAQGEVERAWCVSKVTRLSTTPVTQMRSTYGSDACVLNPGPTAKAFLDLNYGGTGKTCRCV